MKKVYVSEIVVAKSRVRPLGRWKDRVKEYMCVMSATRRGGGGRFSAMTMHLRDVPRRSKASELQIDRSQT